MVSDGRRPTARHGDVIHSGYQVLYRGDVLLDGGIGILIRVAHGIHINNRAHVAVRGGPLLQPPVGVELVEGGPVHEFEEQGQAADPEVVADLLGSCLWKKEIL